MIKNKKPKFKLEEHSFFSTLRGGSGKEGFTLIEMLVAMTIFSTVMGIITGIFITGIRQQKMALDSQIVLNQTSYALEYMSRALRMAKKQLPGDPACLSQDGLNYEIPLEYQILGDENLGRGLRFINILEPDDNYKCQEFYLDLASKQLKYKRGGNPPLDLTSNKLEITSLKFKLEGKSQNDDFQPRVTIFLEIKGKGTLEGSPKIKIQTSISQRNLDVRY